MTDRALSLAPGRGPLQVRPGWLGSPPVPLDATMRRRGGNDMTFIGGRLAGSWSR